MSDKCVDHLNFTEGTCPDCGLYVDKYGNTEDDLRYCCFPDCGCDGSRLCMAKEGASDRSITGNIEGMWKGGSKERVAAVLTLVGETFKNK